VPIDFDGIALPSQIYAQFPVQFDNKQFSVMCVLSNGAKPGERKECTSSVLEVNSSALHFGSLRKCDVPTEYIFQMELQI
jgi:hypothetical protein